MHEIDTDKLAERIPEGVALVDVREPAEYAEARVPGAVNIPMGQLPARLDELDRHAPVYLICASGNRSGAMAEYLAGAGYEAVNVLGGTKAWLSAGHPIERD